MQERGQRKFVAGYKLLIAVSLAAIVPNWARAGKSLTLFRAPYGDAYERCWYVVCLRAHAN